MWFNFVCEDMEKNLLSQINFILRKPRVIIKADF